MVFKTTRYGRKSLCPDRMQATETVCDDDFTDESDFDSDSQDDYTDSEVDEEGNLRDFISDDIEYTDYSSKKMIGTLMMRLTMIIGKLIDRYFSTENDTLSIQT